MDEGVTVLGSLVSHLPSLYVIAITTRVETTSTAIHSLSPLEDPQVQLLLLHSCLCSYCLTYLLRSFDTALYEFLLEDILGSAQFFGSLQILLSSLPLSGGGQGITRASDLFPVYLPLFPLG